MNVPGIADILSASVRSTLRSCQTDSFGLMFALRAQADRMSALPGAVVSIITSGKFGVSRKFSVLIA